MREFHLAENLRRQREARNMTQSELALACGMAPSTIYLMERGRTTMPRLGTMTVLADALGCSVTDLLGEVYEGEAG